MALVIYHDLCRQETVTQAERFLLDALLLTARLCHDYPADSLSFWFRCYRESSEKIGGEWSVRLVRLYCAFAERMVTAVELEEHPYAPGHPYQQDLVDEMEQKAQG